MKKRVPQVLRVVIGLLLIAALIVIVRYGLEQPERRPNVVVLLLDTLRADHLSMNGYERTTTPVLDAFSKECVNFSYAVAAAPWTPPSIASIFTGLYPSAHGMMPPNSRDEARQKSVRLNQQLLTLAELFEQNGYRTGAVTPNPWLKEVFGFNQGFEEYKYFHRVRAEKINAEGIKLIEQFEAARGGAPFFLFLHYLDPHNPYDPPGKFREMFQGQLKSRHYPEKQSRFMGLYDGEIRYMDTELGKLFEYLKQTGLYDNTVIVVVADHGEQFMEHGAQGHGHHLYSEEVHVPLMIKCGQTPRTDKRVVSNLDVFPTVLELAGIAVPEQSQGVSLFAANPPERRGVMSELRRHNNYKAFVGSNSQKLVIDFSMQNEFIVDQAEAGQGAWVYDTPNDYLEESPLNKPELLAELRAEFDGLYSETLRLRGDRQADEVEMDESTVEELKTLGYL